MATGNRPTSHCLQLSIIARFNFAGKTSLNLGEDINGPSPPNQPIPPWLAVPYAHCKILSRGDDTKPTIPLDSKFHFLVPGKVPGWSSKPASFSPSPCVLYIYTLSFPFQLLSYKYPHTPPPKPRASPGLSRMQRSTMTFV